MDPNTPKESMPTPSGEVQFAKNGGNPDLSPGDQQKRKIFKAAAIGVAIIVVIIIALVISLSLATSTKKQTKKSEEVSLSPRPSVDASATSQLGPERVFIQRSAALNSPYDLRMTVPTAWDARFSNATAKGYPWESSLLIQAMLSKFSPLSSSKSNITSNNYWALMDISGWLTTDKNAVPLSAGQKQAWFNKLKSVTTENYASAVGGIVNPRYAAEPGGRQHIVPLAIAGNSFRGFSYITLPSDTSYTPIIVTMLAATLDGKSIAIYSIHNIRDSTWARLNELRERSDSQTNSQTAAAVAEFKAGKLGDDTTLIHDEHIRAISTMTLERINVR